MEMAQHPKAVSTEPAQVAVWTDGAALVPVLLVARGRGHGAGFIRGHGLQGQPLPVLTVAPAEHLHVEIKEQKQKAKM